MVILGINISHDPSVAQITDDKVDFVFDEPRFRRDKWWTPRGGQDNAFLCIEKRQVDPPDDLIFASFDRRWIDGNFEGKIYKDAGLQRELCGILQEEHLTKERMDALEADERFELTFEEDEEDEDKEICKAITDNQFGNMDFHFAHEHHLYHAECAHYLSPYKDEDAIAIVWDGGGAQRLHGDGYPLFQEMESIYYTSTSGAPKLQWQRLSNNRFLSQWGYELPNMRSDCFMCWDDKEIEHDGAEIVISCRPSSGMNFSNMSKEFGCDDKGRAAGKIMGMASYGQTIPNVFNRYTVAQMLEEYAFDDAMGIIQHAVELNPDCKNIVLSGGYSLNCTNNYKYLSEFPDHQFFVDPIPHDGGSALGAALWLKRENAKE